MPRLYVARRRSRSEARRMPDKAQALMIAALKAGSAYLEVIHIGNLVSTTLYRGGVDAVARLRPTEFGRTKLRRTPELKKTAQ